MYSGALPHHILCGYLGGFLQAPKVPLILIHWPVRRLPSAAARLSVPCRIALDRMRSTCPL